VIAYPTVFVLGAGASMPYGFPSGAKLLADANKLSVDELYSQICEQETKATIRSFVETIRLCQDESLDALLEYRPKGEVSVGKLYMAAQLLKSEYDDFSDNVENYKRKGQPWFSYLFSRMAERAKTLEEFSSENHVTFVTYNYDRLIECNLTNGLRAHYAKPLGECAEVLEQMKVIHLHGSLGTFHGGKSEVPYGSVTNAGDEFADTKRAWLRASADTIQIVHQADRTTAEFTAAREALGNAERVIFLGFSFGQQNVDRLGFEHIKKSAQIRLSSLGMAAGEYDVYVRQPMNKFGLSYLDRSSRADGNENWDCRKVLEEHIGAIVRRYD
jgi:SIR2-like domain